MANAWKDIQKDLVSRKYKSNPFEKKYVDLTTSTCTAGETSTDDSFGLDHLSKSIRARSDIISCQVAFLVKEVTDVSENLSKRNPTNTGPRLKVQPELNRIDSFFASEDDEQNIQKRILLKAIENDPNGKLPEEIVGARLLWIEELTKSLSPSKIREILLPFLAAENTLLEQANVIQASSIRNGTSFCNGFMETLLLSTRLNVDAQLKIRSVADGETTCCIKKFVRYIRDRLAERGDDYEGIMSQGTENPREQSALEPLDQRTQQEEKIKLPDPEESGEGDICQDDHVHDDYYSHGSDFQGPNKQSHIERKVKINERGNSRNMKIDEGGNARNINVEGGGKYRLMTQQKEAAFNCLPFNDCDDEGDSRLLSEHSRTLLLNMKNKIARQTKNKNVSDVNKKTDHEDLNPPHIPQKGPIGTGGKRQILEDVVRGIPTLLDLGTALLKHDNALALVLASGGGDFCLRKAAKVDTADDFLLPILLSSSSSSSSSSSNSQGGHGERKGVSRSTLTFLENLFLAESEESAVERGKRGGNHPSQGKGSAVKTNPLDGIRVISMSPVVLMTPKSARAALCLPNNFKNCASDSIEEVVGGNSSINRSAWSYTGYGFGFEKDLNLLLKELRPLEYARSEEVWMRYEGAGADHEWGAAASLFRPDGGDNGGDWGDQRDGRGVRGLGDSGGDLGWGFVFTEGNNSAANNINDNYNKYNSSIPYYIADDLRYPLGELGGNDSEAIQGYNYQNEWHGLCDFNNNDNSNSNSDRLYDIQIRDNDWDNNEFHAGQHERGPYDDGFKKDNRNEYQQVTKDLKRQHHSDNGYDVDDNEMAYDEGNYDGGYDDFVDHGNNDYGKDSNSRSKSTSITPVKRNAIVHEITPTVARANAGRNSKIVEASAVATSRALAVAARALLSVSSIQQLLKRLISPPSLIATRGGSSPSSNLIRLDTVISKDIVADSYPNIGQQEGKGRYATRVFVSLIFLADGYNRDQTADRLLASSSSKDQDRSGSDPKSFLAVGAVSQMHLSRYVVYQKVPKRDNMSLERNKVANSVIVVFK